MSDIGLLLLLWLVYFAVLGVVGTALLLITKPRPLEEFWSRAAKWLGIKPWLPDNAIPLWKMILRPLVFLLLFAATLIPMALLIATLLLVLEALDL